MFKTKEEIVAIKMAMYISKKFKCKAKPIEHNNNNYVYIYNKKIDLLLTVCNTNKKRCIKLEEVSINEKYRNKGIFNNLMATLKNISDVENVTLGLWCEISNNRLFDYYTRIGFKHVETMNDYWLEYN